MIQPPGFCPWAVPTTKGWKHPKRPEILKPASLTQEECDEYMRANGMLTEAEPAPAPAPEPEPQMLTEVGDLESMSKQQLEELGRENGIELDRRKKKTTLINTMKGILKRT